MSGLVGVVGSLAVWAGPASALAPGLGGVDHDLSANRGPSVGSAVALVAENPQRLAATAAGPEGRPRVWISNHGMVAGRFFSRVIPSRSRIATSGGGGNQRLEVCCDPSVSADSAGNIWVAMAATGDGSRIVTNRFAGPALTRPSELSTALPRRVAAPQGAPTIVVDDWPSSPRRGYLYVIWVEGEGPLRQIVFAQCDGSLDSAACDDPDNWTPGPLLPSLSATPSAFSRPGIAVAPNGDLYAIWHDGGTDNAIEMNRCTALENCALAAAWDEETKIEDLDDADPGPAVDPLPQRCPIIAAPAGLVNPAPSVEIGPGGEVYAAYSDLRANGSGTRCSASGSDSTWDSYLAASSAPNQFPAANSAIRLSDDGPLATNDHFLPALSVDRSSGLVEATLYSTKDFQNGRSVQRYYVSSADGGASFSAMAQMSSSESRFSGLLSDGFDFGSYQGADSAQGVFDGAWSDSRLLQGRGSELYLLTEPVETAIVAGPSGVVDEAVGRFVFDSQADYFACSIDGREFEDCSARYFVGPLSNQAHNLRVRATDRVGNPVDLSPAVRDWTVDDQDPPNTRIIKPVPSRVERPAVSIEFEADEPRVTFQCKLDDDPFVECSSPWSRQVAGGRHSIRIRATDIAGNVEPNPALNNFRRQSS